MRIPTPLTLGGAAVGALLLLSLAVSTASSAEPGEKDGERIRRLLDGKPIRGVRSLPGLTAQPSGRLVSRTALPTTMISSLRRYEVQLEGEVHPVRVAFFDLEWSEGEGRIGLGATREGALFGPTLFDDYGKEIDDLDELLARFQGHRGVRLTEASLQPVGEVMTRRDEMLATTKPPPKKEEREVWALFHHHLRMWELESSHAALQRAREEGTGMREPLRRLDEHLNELKPFASNLKGVLEPKEVGRYRRFVDQMLASTEKARVLLDKGNEKAASKLVKGEVKLGCGRCHGSDENQWRRPLEDAIRDLREGAGWRTGSFVVGVDLRPTRFGDADAQLVASTVKALMLLATDAT
ncbi:MAG: hypothetical protein ACF8XB_15710 [Planctomycetota bacterium JB042]